MAAMRSNTKSNALTFDDYSRWIRTTPYLAELSALRKAVIFDPNINDDECLMLCEMLNNIVNARAAFTNGREPEVF